MEKLFSGPLGLLLVIAQAGFFVYVMRGLFQAASGDDTIDRAFGPKRRSKPGPRAGARGPGAGRGGAAGWSKTDHVLETHFDAVSGAMKGYVRTGPYAGLSLDDLTRTDCMRLHEFCRVEDPDSAAFLETYMFRRFAGGGPRADTADRKRRAPPPPPPPPLDDDGPMTRERAHAILGLQLGAEEAEIHRAHRALIKKHHPDHGGSHERAALINQAKDMLLAKVAH